MSPQGSHHLTPKSAVYLCLDIKGIPSVISLIILQCSTLDPSPGKNPENWAMFLTIGGQKFSSIQSFIHTCPFSTKCQCSTKFRTSVTTMNLHQIFITQPDSILRGAIYYWQCEYWCVSLLLWVSIFSSIEVNGEIINYFSRRLWEEKEINDTWFIVRIQYVNAIIASMFSFR